MVVTAYSIWNDGTNTLRALDNGDGVYNPTDDSLCLIPQGKTQCSPDSYAAEPIQTFLNDNLLTEIVVSGKQWADITEYSTARANVEGLFKQCPNAIGCHVQIQWAVDNFLSATNKLDVHPNEDTTSWLNRETIRLYHAFVEYYQSQALISAELGHEAEVDNFFADLTEVIEPLPDKEFIDLTATRTECHGLLRQYYFDQTDEKLTQASNFWHSPTMDYAQKHIEIRADADVLDWQRIVEEEFNGGGIYCSTPLPGWDDSAPEPPPPPAYQSCLDAKAAVERLERKILVRVQQAKRDALILKLEQIEASLSKAEQYSDESAVAALRGRLLQLKQEMGI